MARVRNSALLDGILDYAKGLGKQEGVSAEKFVVAVIDTVRGDNSVTATAEEKQTLEGTLAPLLGNLKDLDSLRKELMREIEIRTDEREVSADAVALQVLLYRVRDASGKAGAQSLTPDAVMDGILKAPDAFFKRILEANPPQTKPGRKKPAEERRKQGSSAPAGEDDKPAQQPSVPVAADSQKKSAAQQPAPEKSAPETPEEPKAKATGSKQKALAELTRKIIEVRDTVSGIVYGQDHAVSVLTEGLFHARLSELKNDTSPKPRATFLFAGPSGVGKTFLAETAAKALGLPFRRFDMSEYSSYESTVEFLGSNQVYKGAKKGNVTSFVSDNPRCVLLFDEIEKAHQNVIHLFLQILDRGVLRDANSDKEVSFAKSIIIFTTNAGRTLYRDAETTDFSGVSRKVILKALEEDINPLTDAPYFPPAMCSRFGAGNVVMFNYITAHTLRQIAKKVVDESAKEFTETTGIRIDIDDRVYSALLFAEGGFADARTVTTRAQSFFEGEMYELVRLINANDHQQNKLEQLSSITLCVEDPLTDPEIAGLFDPKDRDSGLVFAPEGTAERFAKVCPGVTFKGVRTAEEAAAELHDNDYSFLLLDIMVGENSGENFLNREDIPSAARDCYRSTREKYPELPVYILMRDADTLNAEEQNSLLGTGARGLVSLAVSDSALRTEILMIAQKLHQQSAMDRLARASKSVSFETAQLVRDNGTAAEIRLFDLKLKTMVEAGDSGDLIDPVSRPETTFDKVIGAEDAKRELRYVIEFLKNPKKYASTGVGMPKGILLYGPPGTGKTMLAKAMAGESGFSFIAAEGNQFVNKYWGVGRDRVKELFRRARKYAPTILFIDEIDAIGKERTGDEDSRDLEVTLTALLTEMEGFSRDLTRPVFVLAATNYEVEPGSKRSLDQAFLRRFDRRLFIDLPTRDERLRYLRMKREANRALQLSDQLVGNIALRSTGRSLADLESICEASLRLAICNGKSVVTDEVFEEAFETFLGGEAKKWDESLLERTARHEAGHAYLCWKSGETPSYVTVVARADHGGYMQTGDREKQMYTKAELLADIRTSLGGRAAELVFYGSEDGLAPGPSGDLKSATALAQRYLCSYGMSEEFGLSSLPGDAVWSGPFAEQIRTAVNSILSEELAKAVAAVEGGRAAVDALARRLMTDNHLTGAEVVQIFEANA